MIVFQNFSASGYKPGENLIQSQIQMNLVKDF